MHEEDRRGYWASEALATDQLALLVILGSVDLAAGKTPIENVDRCGASLADGRPIRHPDKMAANPRKMNKMSRCM
jgi:predicted lipoprotein